MMDTFAQILEEAFQGLSSVDSIEASWHLEAIRELITECEESLKADLIPEEMRVV